MLRIFLYTMSVLSVANGYCYFYALIRRLNSLWGVDREKVTAGAGLVLDKRYAFCLIMYASRIT